MIMRDILVMSSDSNSASSMTANLKTDFPGPIAVVTICARYGNDRVEVPFDTLVEIVARRDFELERIAKQSA